MEYCIVNVFDCDNKDIPNINEVLKIFFTERYKQKYSLDIVADKIYTKEETNDFFEKYGDAFVTFVTNEDENLGIDIINALASYEEKSDLILETLEYETIDEYKYWLIENNYTFKELTNEEYDEYIKKRFGK